MNQTFLIRSNHPNKFTLVCSGEREFMAKKVTVNIDWTSLSKLFSYYPFYLNSHNIYEDQFDNNVVFNLKNSSVSHYLQNLIESWMWPFSYLPCRDLLEKVTRCNCLSIEPLRQCLLKGCSFMVSAVFSHFICRSSGITTWFLYISLMNDASFLIWTPTCHSRHFFISTSLKLSGPMRFSIQASYTVL